MKICEQLETHKRDKEGIKKIKKLRKNLAELKQPRQKFCARWETEFPWLKADRIYESIGICMVCRTDLVCKKSHLERHEKSFKHTRLQELENAATVNVQVKKNPESRYLEDYCYENANKTIGANGPKLRQAEKSENGAWRSNFTKNELVAVRRSLLSKSNRLKLLKRIDKERDELDKCLRNQRTPDVSHMLNTIVPQKDSFDLFFESMSCTVKALPPKLAAEVKSRVSQLVAEFELRAILERESCEKASAN
uniref:BESS domain-containing protein n=1 Tax=Glossina morsitans morsitans TaxID=37546 RepID=A0A1B0G7K2_GLOMM